MLMQLPVFFRWKPSEVKMIDFGMAVKYDHGVWFKAWARVKAVQRNSLSMDLSG